MRNEKVTLIVIFFLFFLLSSTLIFFMISKDIKIKEEAVKKFEKGGEKYEREEIWPKVEIETRK